MCMAHGLKFPGIRIDFFLLAALKQMFKQIYVSFFELTECLVIFFLYFPFFSLWLRVLRWTHTWIKSVQSLHGPQTVKYRGSKLFFHKKIVTAFFHKKIGSMLAWTDILFVLNSPAFALGREALCFSPFLSIEIIKLRITDCVDISLRQLSL